MCCTKHLRTGNSQLANCDLRSVFDIFFIQPHTKPILKKKVVFIVNPISGTGEKQSFIAEIHRHFKNSGIEYEIATTSRAGEGKIFAQKAAAENFNIAVAVGGDGTVNEVASGIIGSETALFIAPFGSGNGLARHLNYPLNNVEAHCDRIKNGKIRNMDVGKVNQHYFFATAGLGFDAHIAHEFAKGAGRGLKKYAKKVFQAYFDYDSPLFNIQAGERKIEKKYFILTVANASEYGNGAKINPFANDADGLLDICCVSRPNAFILPFFALAFMSGKIEGSHLFSKFSAAECSITTVSPVCLHVDGEPLRAESHFEFSVLPSALRVLTI